MLRGDGATFMPGDPPQVAKAAPAPKAVPTAAKSAPKPKPVGHAELVHDLASPTATERRAQYQGGRGGEETLYFGSPQHGGVGDGHNSEAGNKFPSADGWESPRYDASEAGAPENPEEDLQEQRNPPVARGNNQVPTPPVDQNQKANVYEDGMYWRTLGLDHH